MSPHQIILAAFKEQHCFIWNLKATYYYVLLQFSFFKKRFLYVGINTCVELLAADRHKVQSCFVVVLMAVVIVQHEQDRRRKILYFTLQDK